MQISSAMEEVGEAGYQTEEAVNAQKVKLDSFAEWIALGGLYSEEHGRRVKMGINSHVVEKRCTAASKPHGGEVNSLTRKKSNQAVQKAAQNMAWSKSTKFKYESVTGRRGGRMGLFSDRARRIPRRTCSRRGVATRGSPQPKSICNELTAYK